MYDLASDPTFVNLSAYPHLVVDLKYASPDNFMGVNLYGSLNQAYLHRDAAQSLRRAIDFLQEEKPGWSFIVFDALRPRSVQWVMWKRVRETAERKYVADAQIGSPHNYGMALDLSLLDGDGRLVDMGTGFDQFGDLSEPQLEEKFVREGRLQNPQRENRLILRKAMTRAGFLQLPHEWWHFNALSEEEIRRHYSIIE